MENIRGLFYRDFYSSHIAEILDEVYTRGLYQQFLNDRKDLTILDIGSNIGLTISYFYNYAKKIYAIEPTSEHVEVINTMLDYNKMHDKVTVIQKAVSDKDGKATFYRSSKNSTANSLSSYVSQFNEPTEEVETVRMDTLFTQNKIEHVDFMKLDVEGAELDILCGEGFANVADKIDSMLIEYHVWTGRNPSQVPTTLADYGFEVFQLPAQAVLFGAKRK